MSVPVQARDPDTEAERRRELDAVRESFQAELERKSARIAQLERHAEELVLGYRSSLSWRLTMPVRAAGRLVRAARRR